jgi:hypothetical protein
MATNNTSSSNPRAENMGDVLDVLASGIAKTAANEPKLEPQHLVAEVPAEPARQLLTEIMLADRWVCSIARLQRWRSVGEGPQYLKIVGKVLYRLKDIEAYEEACLIRKVFFERTHGGPERVGNCSNDLESVRNSLGGAEHASSQTA